MTAASAFAPMHAALQNLSRALHRLESIQGIDREAEEREKEEDGEGSEGRSGRRKHGGVSSAELVRGGGGQRRRRLLSVTESEGREREGGIEADVQAEGEREGERRRLLSVGGVGGEPELWMGRAELHLPLRLNRVEDLWRAGALREGQLFPVRHGLVKHGEKHPGRRAPELPLLSRMYLSFLLLELELEIPVFGQAGRAGEKGTAGASSSGGSDGSAGPVFPGQTLNPSSSYYQQHQAFTGSGGVFEALESGKSLPCFCEGMSLVMEERCILPGNYSRAGRENSDGGSGSGLAEGEQGAVGAGEPATGTLMSPGGRPCKKTSKYLRAFMVVRHTDMERNAAHTFDLFRKHLRRNLKTGAHGWIEAQQVEGGESGVGGNGGGRDGEGSSSNENSGAGAQESKQSAMPWLSPCLRSYLKRLRLIRCIPEAPDGCMLGLPLGSAPDNWRLLLWSWKPQSLRTAEVLLFQSGMAGKMS